MKTIECTECRQEFNLSYLSAQKHSGICSNCQLEQHVQEANDQIEVLQAKKDTILPRLKALNRKKSQLKVAYMNVKNQWQELANEYEALDHEMAEIAHLRDLEIGTKKVVKQKSTKSVNTAAMAEKKALKALAGLDPKTRALVLAQLNKTS